MKTIREASWEGHRRLQQASNVVELWRVGQWVTWRCNASDGFGLDKGMNKFPMSSIHCEAYGCPPNLCHVDQTFDTLAAICYDFHWCSPTIWLYYTKLYYILLYWPILYGHIAMWCMVWFDLRMYWYLTITLMSSPFKLVFRSSSLVWFILQPHSKYPNLISIDIHWLWYRVLPFVSTEESTWTLDPGQHGTTDFILDPGQTPVGSQRLQTTRLKAWAKRSLWFEFIVEYDSLRIMFPNWDETLNMSDSINYYTGRRYGIRYTHFYRHDHMCSLHSFHCNEVSSLPSANHESKKQVSQVPSIIS